MGALGVPDPLQEAKDYSARQTAANAAAIDPSNPAAPNAAPTGPNILPPDQTPQATKTPQDMGSIMVDLARREQANQGWNQALGMGFAAFAQPRDREMVSKMFNVNPIDPYKMGQSIMEANSAQQGQDRNNQLLAIANDPNKLGQIAHSLNMDPQALAFMIKQDPAKAASLIAAGATPTTDLASLQQLQRLLGSQPGANKADINAIANQVMAKVAGPGEAAQMIADQKNYQDTHNGQLPPWANNLAAYKQYTVNEAAKETDRQTASTELVDKNEATQTLKDDLSELKDSPGLHSIMTTPGKRDVALKAMNDSTTTDIPSMMARWGLSNDEAKAVALLRRIGGATTETAMRGMAGTGTRVTQAEVGPLKDAITMTQNLNQSYEDYIHGAVNNAITKTKRAIAANYGNTGNVKNMPDEYKPWLNDAFKKDGQLYKEGSGADDIPDAQPVPNSEIAQGKELLKTKPYLKQEMLDNWQQRGLNTSKLRSTSPSSW
jgi:hypothetical protein